jgi:glycosyltransferase involved in cell wall biosynthesis
VGVVALVDKHWGPFWMTEHQLLSRLARYFHVVWIDPARSWRTALARRPWSVGGVRRPLPLPGFVLYEPEIWLPQRYRRDWLGRQLFDARLRRARGLLARAGCQEFVLHLWSPGLEQALTAPRFDLRCYHITDEYTFADEDLPLTTPEARLIASVDQVYVVSPALLEKKGGINPHTELVPNGVDYAAYAAEAPEPDDMAGIPRPRVGYSGWIKKQLDWELLDQLTQRRPDWSFVLVGERNVVPEMAPVLGRLASRSNVHFLGGKRSHELARYPQHFDVCLMPYRQNGYTKYIFPLKLHEYLASGRPTVGSRIRSLVPYAGVVALATTLDEWEAAITEALRPGTRRDGRRAAGRAVAREHDWARLAHRVASSMARRLGLQLPALGEGGAGLDAPE